MKLKNKKTGEVGYPYFQNWKEITCVIVDENAIQIAEYTSLAELNKEWQDYEEPKGYWYIRDGGNIDYNLYGKSIINRHKEIGNYFDTREEAEKELERLRAWKRLKDKGFKFSKDWVCRYDQPEVENHTYYEFVAICEDGIRFDDLDLLFSGGKDE